MSEISKVIIAMIIVASLALGCHGGNPAYPERAPGIIMPVDYGNGVYYFQAQRATFGVSLAAFRQNNPNKQIVAMTCSGTNSYDEGYWVVTAPVREME